MAGCRTGIHRWTGVLLLLVPLSMRAQAGTVTGTVTLSDTANAAGIFVTLLDQNRTTTTPANGQFTFSNVPAGSIKLQAGKLFYCNARRDTVLSSGQTLNINLSLNRAIRDTIELHQTSRFISGITNNGNIGSLNHFVEPGDPGFTWSGQQQLFEASFMMGVDTNRVSDAARFILGLSQNNLDQDFRSLSDVVVRTMGPDSSVLLTSFDDSRSNLPPGIPSQPMGVRVLQTSYSFGNSLDNSYLIVRLALTNTSTVTLRNLLAGWYIDWDVGSNPNTNRGETLQLENTIPGFNGGNPFETEVTYQRSSTTGGIFMGIVPLSQAKFRASRIASNVREIYPDAPNRGLTEVNKYRYMAFRRDTLEYGDLGVEEDLSTIVGVGGLEASSFDSSTFTLAPGATADLGFGFVGGNDSLSFLQSVRRCQTKWVELRNPLLLVGAGDEPRELPLKPQLDAAYPNPFNPSTSIGYRVPALGHVIVKIYNVLGAEVRTLVEAERLAGTYLVEWDGTSDRGNPVSSGAYFVTMRYRPYGSGHAFLGSQKLLLLR